MMKTYIYKTLILVLGVGLSLNCSDDFLDDPKPSASVSEEQIFNSRVGVESFLAGINRSARALWSSTYLSECNMASIGFGREVKGNNLILANNWFNWDYDHNNRMSTNSRPAFTWNFCYYLINQVNALINGVEGSDAISESDKRELLAQGRAYRANLYFQLALEYQHAYSYDPNQSAPPIYTGLTTEGKPMSTLQEMYDFILDDLEYAVDNLSEDRLGKSYINNRVAYGLLARVHQVTGNWPAAQTAANAAYGSNVQGALAPAWYTDGFVSLDSPEWMWGMAQTTDQTAGYYTVPSVLSDFQSGYYYAVYFNYNFVDKFSATDVRNTFWNPYGLPQGDYRQYVSTKFTFSFDADMVLMRSPEMILIEAEALYWQDRDTEARSLLYQLQVNRDPNAVESSNTGDALLEELLLERQKELYGELGVEWYDAKRLQRGITRDPVHRTVVNLEPNDLKFILQVPLGEIDANEAIDESVNDDR